MVRWVFWVPLKCVTDLNGLKVNAVAMETGSDDLIIRTDTTDTWETPMRLQNKLLQDVLQDTHDFLHAF
jgi:hypothetical protein